MWEMLQGRLARSAEFQVFMGHAGDDDSRYTPESWEETPGCGGILEVISIQVE